MPRTPDVSICLFARNEGPWLYSSLTSIERSVAYAERGGLSVDLLGVLYEPTELIVQLSAEFMGPPWSIIRLDSPNLGQARRTAAMAAKGQHISFLDTGDLWSENWILAAVAASQQAAPAVWRHEAVMQASEDYYDPSGYACTFQPDEADGYEYASMLGENPFSSSFLALREVLAAVPFPSEAQERGWHNLDWWWNCNVVGEGYGHRIVPETFLYRRIKSRDAATLVRIGPTRLSRKIAGRYSERRSTVED
jgi:glycosyltransferase involved in cell wall biosynthesis